MRRRFLGRSGNGCGQTARETRSHQSKLARANEGLNASGVFIAALYTYELYYLINNTRNVKQSPRSAHSFSTREKVRPPKLKLIALGVVNFEIAEEFGLVFDLGAVADDDDLHVGGVEVFAGSGEQVGWRQPANFFAIGLQVIVG